MKRKFTIVIVKRGTEYEARCQEMPDAIAYGRDPKDALEKVRAVIIKKLEDGSDGGDAPKPHPVSPSPQGPIIVEAAHEKPDA